MQRARILIVFIQHNLVKTVSCKDKHNCDLLNAWVPTKWKVSAKLSYGLNNRSMQLLPVTESPLVKAHRVVSMQIQNKINKQSWTLVDATPWTELAIPVPSSIPLTSFLFHEMTSSSETRSFPWMMHWWPLSGPAFQIFPNSFKPTLWFHLVQITLRIFFLSKQKHTYLSCSQGFEL